MENAIGSFFGGEFQRHFWPGLFLTALLGAALYLNGVNPFMNVEVLSVVLILVPFVILAGILIDFLGHVFVGTQYPRRVALGSLHQAETVLSLIKLKLRPHLGATVDTYSLDTLSEYCMFLARFLRRGPYSQEKYEEQYAYFELYRTLMLFLFPLILYILLALAATWLGIYDSTLVKVVIFICWVLYQSVALLLAYMLFRLRLRSGSLLYRLAMFYFQPLFFSYVWVATVQLGTLFHYFLEFKEQDSSNDTGSA